ncbi:MAG TPA: OmpA family protein [Ideonella sp.]|uniref:OmpA family protein n=1 Tax=Ideonella sp. TaxID=1929293 RepID=UPI002B65B789|nr:OmpA family protein [Ideonella sp.]HSI50533.1 OmpA family protein [Ideonella sp.]
MKLLALFRLLLAAPLLLMTPVLPAQAAAVPHVDLPDAKDHPLITRFTGSWLFGAKLSDWDQTQFPTGMGLANRHWTQTVTVEGKLTRLFYLAPRGKTPLEVHRNYQQALTAAGFQPKFSCETACQDLYFAMDKTIAYDEGVRWVRGANVAGKGSATYGVTDGGLSYDGRLLYGTLSKAGQDVHILVYTSSAVNDQTDTAATFIQIVEPKAMATGQVQVNAAALQQGLAADGKIALYGLYFDTGKSEVKPESKAQLDEMAKLLQGQPGLKVYIVGHTDNQGALDANLALSQARAQAVVQALVTQYKVDTKRLAAKGVANLAPVASNAAEDGRARNRRVELVVQ